MRALIVALSPFVLGALLSCARAAEPELSLTISVPHDTMKAGAGVKLKILLTNLTDHVIYVERILVDYGPEIEYSLDVRDDQGKLASLTRYGRALRGGPDEGDERLDCGDCDTFGAEMQPHENATDEVVVSKIYDLSRPGKYTIQVSRAQGNESHAIVKSNTITLTVTE